MTASTQYPILVTGASGHLGRGVLAHLLETYRVPAGEIIAATRKPESLAEFAARGVVVRRADFNDDAASLAAAFSGAKRLLLISTDALDAAGTRLRQHRNAIEAAVKAGVAHLIYTSMIEPEGSPIPFAPDHYGTEQALAASGLGWTVLRNAWYFENLFLSLRHVLATGKWYTSAGEGRIAHIARDDLARAAAAVLVSEVENRIYTLTGPEAFTTAEIARLVSETAGKPIELVQVPDEALVRGMVAGGLPEGMARVFTSIDTNTRLGRIAEVTDDFRKLTGTEPQRYREWLAANRAVIAGA